MMIVRMREWSALILVVLLPFHAFLVTVLTKIIHGPGQAPWSALVVWKEALLLFVLLLVIVEIARDLITGRKAFRSYAPDKIDACVISLVALATVVTFLTHGNPVLFAYGLKYDFLPLVSFVILRKVQWSDVFVDRLQNILIFVGSGVALLGVVSLLLPQSFFTALGYSDLHSIYVSDKPLAAFQYIGQQGARRIQSVMSGPNQLGIWLLLPFSLAAVSVLNVLFPKEFSMSKIMRFMRSDKKTRSFSEAYVILLLLALFLSFSRSAWIAAFFVVGMAMFRYFDRKTFTKMSLRFFAACIFAIVFLAMISPNTIVRLSSSRGHIVRPLQAMADIARHPLGQGLGSAGPASHKVSDTCVHLRPQDDPSWAEDRQDLCVFLGTQQVQPLGRECTCPVLPENWYLQIGIEIGIVGLILYCVFLFSVLRKLWSAKDEILEDVALLSFIGVSVASMTLHAWEDAAIAYSVWTVIAVSMSRRSYRG